MGVATFLNLLNSELDKPQVEKHPKFILFIGLTSSYNSWFKPVSREYPQGGWSVMGISKGRLSFQIKQPSPHRQTCLLAKISSTFLVFHLKDAEGTSR